MSTLETSRRALLVTLAGLLAALLGAAPPASALQGKPLTITRFSIEPTAATVTRPYVAHGVEGVELINEPYTPGFTQAGGHPWALTTTGEFAREPNPAAGFEEPSRNAKDVVVTLPPGLLGDPQAAPRCSLPTITGEGGGKCPADTQVGFYELEFERGLGERFGKVLAGAIVNVAPEKGQSAEFALIIPGASRLVTPLLTAHLVRTPAEHGQPAGYSFAVASNDLPSLNSELAKFELTFWGVPADPSHDRWRGAACSDTGGGAVRCEGGNEAAGVEPGPFLTLPSACSAGPEVATLRADSWQEPGSVSEGRYSGYAEATATLPGATGCGLLQFGAGTGLAVEPDTALADAPVGLGVNLKVPQTEKPDSLATPLLRETKVTLPEGMSVSPGVVDGIQACNATGPEGINITGPESEQVGPSGELQLAPGHCPDASVVGEAEAITPFLPNPVKGHVYLARPGCGGAGQAPCTNHDAADGNLYKLYLELGGAGALGDAGIVFKVPLETEANPATGQLTAIAGGLVQAPYSEVRIRLNGGPRAPLDNPPTCSQATATADLLPWSAPGSTPEGTSVAGTPDSLSTSFFTPAQCSAPPVFSPTFTAGTVIPQAAQYSAFTMNLGRQDREQYVKGIQIHTPPGLLGMLSSVPLCEEPLAASGHCPEASRIGTTTVASGAGSHPFEISGNVYLTQGYGGAPFGLSIVTNAVAGPFNLGLVVVRARIAVDPTDSTLTVTTDETGPYAIPQIVFGVPLRLKRIMVNIDRPGFMFNPTNCKAQQITATITGNQNATATVASPFAVGACKSLAFTPGFTVTTSGHTSRADGASLDAKVTYPAGSLGNQANISYVKVELPRQLPSRLTTLQKACLAKTFETNPSRCPPQSVIGIVRTTTPVLPVPLQGPVYFISHGGEAFPSLVAVLQGDGVRVDLTGTTFISKAGITSSTFKTVPDVPVSSFELYLPEGPFSALTANANLCSLTTSSTPVHRKVTVRVRGRTRRRTVTTHLKHPATLAMPTEFIAQNGAQIHRTTTIQVTGCPKLAAASARAHGRSARLAKGRGR